MPRQPASCAVHEPHWRHARNRLRQFPSLVNCCTIDWFTDWPSDALASVAKHFLDDVDLADGIRDGVVNMVVYMHRSVQSLSDKYRQELRRYFYVTPTSYLELINTVRLLVAEKRSQISSSRQRYLVGLQQLEKTAEAVRVMQEQLNALKPQLLQAQRETDALMVTLQQENTAAAAKKASVQDEEKELQDKTAKALAIKEAVKQDLAVAMPALESAIKALNSWTRAALPRSRP